MALCGDVEYYTVIPKKGPTLYPGMLQRWAIVRRADSIVGPDDKRPLVDEKDPRIMKAARHFVMNAMSIVGANSWTQIASVKVLAWGHGVEPSIFKAPEHIKKIPEFHFSVLSDRQVSVVTIVVEFYFEGTTAQLKSKQPITGRQWPWYVMGVGAFPCPEEMGPGGGLLAVLPPTTPPLHQITPMEELTSPLRKVIIETHDLIEKHGPELPTLDDTKSAALGAMNVLLWGGAGILLFNLYQSTRGARRSRKTVV